MQKFEEYVFNLKRKINKINKKEILFVCIGTKDVLWDSIGPQVGTLLLKKLGKNSVIGNLNANICNKEDLKKHTKLLNNKYIIAIDSAVGNRNLIGEIFIRKSPITMGCAINKNKGEIGHLSIKTVIDKKFSARDITVISSFIANGIFVAFDFL